MVVDLLFIKYSLFYSNLGIIFISEPSFIQGDPSKRIQKGFKTSNFYSFTLSMGLGMKYVND